MAIRDSMKESAKPFLAPGEDIQAVFGAQTASNWVAAFGGVLFFLHLNRYRIVAVTNQRILVLDAGPYSIKAAREVVAELPRSTRLGPTSGIWHIIPVTTAQRTERLRVNKRFFKDVAVADAAATAANA